MRLLRLFIIFFFVFILCPHSYSEESFFKGEYSLSAGYIFNSTSQSDSIISEYNAPLTSPAINLDLKDLAGHSKYIGELEFENRDDFKFHLQYDYKDIFRAEIRKNDFFHNTSHKNFSYSTAFNDYRKDDKYFYDLSRNSFFFKIKPDIIPYSLRVYVEEYNKKGLSQKRFYGQSRIDSVTKDYNLYSTSNYIDLKNELYGASIDGMIGGINFMALFEAANIKNNAYDTSEGGEIQITPSITRNYKQLALYTNQAGQLSFIFSFTNSEINNNRRDELNQKSAEYSYNNSSLMFTYYPIKDLKFYLKLRYEDKDEKSPEKIRFLGVDYPSEDLTPSTAVTLSYGLYYNLAKDWRFRYDGKSKEIKRAGVLDNEFKISNTFGIEGRINKTQIKLKETVENTENPYYKGSPKNLYKTALSVSHPLSERSGIDFDYSFSMKKNDDPRYYIQEDITNSFILNYYCMFDNDLNLNAYLGFDRERYKYDMNIYMVGNIPNTPYRTNRIYGDINLSKSFTKKSSGYADLFYQRGYGNYYPDYTYKLNEITAIDFYQYGILLGHNCKIRNNETVKLELSYKKHTEKTFEALSGDIKTIYIAWEKRW